MDYTILGRTGLRVSRMGLGCGGHSRLGLATGGTPGEAMRVVREALNLGVNFVDTAESYGTEDVVGQALVGQARDRIVLSTKAGVQWQEQPGTAGELTQRVEDSLRRLQTEYVDVFHLHGVTVEDYPYAVQELLPALKTMQAAGKIRFLGITERFISDPAHRMLAQAVRDNYWDVVMVGFNLVNQSARRSVLPITQQNGIGTLDMFAVRRALSQPDALRELIREVSAQNLLDGEPLDPQNPLDFLTENGVAAGLPEAAYRFCRREPGMDVVLSGTGNVEHLRDNATSLSLPSLPEAVLERLHTTFARVDSVSGN